MADPADQKWVITVQGPTAVGKTAMALQLAKAFDTAVLSADSRQCYREMTIGTAKPGQQARAEVPHGFIDTHTIHQPVSVADFTQEGLQFLRETFRNRNVAIVAGGSGLYLKALLEGLDPVPQPEPEARKALQQEYQSYGIKPLAKELAEQDPEGYARIDAQNPARIIRALEVLRTSGHSITTYWHSHPAPRPFRVQKIGLSVPRNELHQRINGRCEQMLKTGLLDEVKGLYPFSHHEVLQTIGYQEFFAHLAGKATYHEAVERFKAHTRQLAKRQLTWFRRDQNLHWVSPHDTQAALEMIDRTTGLRAKGAHLVAQDH